MQDAILFKILQRKYKFRNAHNWLSLPEAFMYDEVEYKSAANYIENLRYHNIKFTYPTHADYPCQFLKMKEPPLFIEYIGKPVWQSSQFISVVGSREIQTATEEWLRSEFEPCVRELSLGVVSGGARGVDQFAHLIALKNNLPTVFVLPSGLVEMYPLSLIEIKERFWQSECCFMSEFEIDQKLHKSHFYFRNRLISALGNMTLVAQATLKSGSLLTVHHSLEMGRPVVTIPAHPSMLGFEGNLKLLYEGAYLIRHQEDLRDFWLAESWSN